MMRGRAIFAMAALVLAGACAAPLPGSGPEAINDPYEAQNRKAHAFNRDLDNSILRKAGAGYVKTVPTGVRRGVSNFADTVSLPQTVVNQVLQGRLGDATRNSLRFAVNATLGFGGIADVAKDMGMPKDESDFGETLHVWGLPEGAYLELPALGPSTERDALGDIVDMFTNPLDHVIPSPQNNYGTAARVLDYVGERGEFGDTIDSILYDSADSYAQLRLIYLQNRRYELGGEAAVEETYIDPEALDTEGF